MPPLYQDPLFAVPGAGWRWLDVARSLVDVSSQAWVLALVALAVYSFLERDVKDILKSFLPLALALAAAGALALAARAVGGMPRPLEGGGHSLGPLLRRAFPSHQVAAVVVFATYTAFVYRRRAVRAVLVAVAVGIGHAVGGAHWAADLAGGGLAGILVGVAAYAMTVRLLPEGHVARLRAGREGAAARAEPGSP